MEFTRDELITISNVIHQLLGLHISSNYDAEELVEKIDTYLYEDNDEIGVLIYESNNEISGQ